MNVFTRMWKTLVGTNKIDTEVLHSAGGNSKPSPSNFKMPWVLSDSRKNVCLDINMMDKHDSLVANAIDTYATFASCWKNVSMVNNFGFKVEIASDENDISSAKKQLTSEEKKALDILHTMVENTGLNANTKEFMRSMTKYGDLFTELVFDDKNNIKRIKMFPEPWTIIRNEDEYGRLKTGDPKVTMEDPSKHRDDSAFIQVDDAGNVTAAFYPYQIVQWSYGRKGGNKYSESIFAGVVTPWKRLYAQEDSLAFARLSRAFDKMIHRIPISTGTTPQEAADIVEKYRKTMTTDQTISFDNTNEIFEVQSADNPLSVTTDFYLARFYTDDGKTIDGDIENMKGGTTSLDNINDIYWGMNRILGGMGVPMTYLNMRVGGMKAFVDKTPEDAKEAFATSVIALQDAHERGLREIFDLQLVLKGILPENINYRIVYPKIMSNSVLDMNSITHTNAASAQIWIGLGIPPEIVGSKLLDLTPQEIETWVASLNENAEEDTNESEDTVETDENE